MKFSTTAGLEIAQLTSLQRMPNKCSLNCKLCLGIFSIFGNLQQAQCAPMKFARLRPENCEIIKNTFKILPKWESFDKCGHTVLSIGTQLNHHFDIMKLL